MNQTSKIAFSLGALMIVMTLVNAITIPILNSSILRSEVISGLSSVSLLLIGFLNKDFISNKSENIKLVGKRGFLIEEKIDINARQELAWGSQMVLTATPAATILIYLRERVILQRGIISNSGNVFIPGDICKKSMQNSRFISLVSTKHYPGKSEFDPILENLPSVIVFPLLDRGWLIVGGNSERCFTRSDELWIEGWSKKLVDIL